MNVSDTLKTRIITVDTSESPESTGSKRNMGHVATAQVTSAQGTAYVDAAFRVPFFPCDAPQGSIDSLLASLASTLGCTV